MCIILEYGRRTLRVAITYSERKYLSITVHPDLKITARAPNRYSRDFVYKRLLARATWMVRQLDYFEQFQPVLPKKEYVGGETHYYLGRQYRLNINKAEVARVRLIGAFFEIDIPNPQDSMFIKKCLLKWYSDHAKKLFRERIDKQFPLFSRMGLNMPRIAIRRMKKRWGSCTAQNAIMLNTELIKAPTYCIDYVVVHELCHLVHPNHTPRFYQLLGRLQPDWEKRKARLEKIIV